MKLSLTPTSDTAQLNRIRRNSAVPIKPYRPSAGLLRLSSKPNDVLSPKLTDRLNSARAPVSVIKANDRPPTSKRNELIAATRPQSSSTRSSSVAFTEGRIENYTIGKQLGQGAYAVVKLGTHRSSKQRYAIKTYEKSKLIDPQRKQSVKREMRLLQRLAHPRIIQFHESIESPLQINIVMEYVGGTSLHSYVRRHTSRKLHEEEARRLFRQIVQGVAYCHERAVTHRDIKLENILLDSNSDVKIIDFGFATCTPHDQKSRVFCGTPSYMAPEIVNRKEYIGPPVDVWALGVLLFTMLSGSFPFRGINDKDLYKKISRGSFLVPPGVSDAARAMICGMIAIDPTKRPSCSEILKLSWLNETPSSKFLADPDKPGETVEQTEKNSLRQADTQSHLAAYNEIEKFQHCEGVLGVSNRMP